MTALLGALTLAPLPVLHAEDRDETKTRRVKAAYLYNFAKFIEWPHNTFKDDKAPFVICVVGDDSFAHVLDNTVKSKKISGRPIKTKKLHWRNHQDRAELQSCQILYIGTSEKVRIRGLLDHVKNKHVLLVSEIPRFARNGGIIGFVLERGRILFEISREALTQAQLKASSKLLKLARIVKPKNRLGEQQRDSSGER